MFTANQTLKPMQEHCAAVTRLQLLRITSRSPFEGQVVSAGGRAWFSHSGKLFLVILSQIMGIEVQKIATGLVVLDENLTQGVGGRCSECWFGQRAGNLS